MTTDAEMCAAVWTWLTGTTVTTQQIDGTPLQWPLYWRVRGTGCFVPIPDYLHDEAASAGLLEELAGRVDVLEVLHIDGRWTVGWPCRHIDRASVMGADSDRKRAVLLAAWEASKA